MPLLLTESLDPVRRETSHQHIETCDVCGLEWSGWKETWAVMAALPEVEVPAGLKSRFLAAADVMAPTSGNVVPFQRRPALRWLTQAAAVTIIAGAAWYGGHATAPRFEPTAATIDSVTPIQRPDMRPVSLAETREVDAAAMSPVIEGNPNISNVQFVDADASDDRIGVSFDMTSRWTVSGSPKERSIIRLLSYMLENETAQTRRSNALDYVRTTYADPEHADPEIANALAKVLRSDSNEGVRIRAVETLTTLPPAVATQTRDALVEALRSDPNPAVRIKAVDALANMVRSGAVLDAVMVDTLRQKASQDDENLYVRVKAAEALGSIRP